MELKPCKFKKKEGKRILKLSNKIVFINNIAISMPRKTVNCK
jgi:hypothetical protein